MKTYNIYCDESCHLENDHEKVMIIGGIRCEKKHRRRICADIQNIKKAHSISEYAEIKWNKVSICNIEYFKNLVDYFFANNEMQFRAVIVDKTKLRHEDFNQTHDDFYYKIYFHCLSGLVIPSDENYIYIDKKDTRGAYKRKQLLFYLTQKNHDFNGSRIKRIQSINSSDAPIMQLTDLLIGAIGYHNRVIQQKGNAKTELISRIIEKSGYMLEKSTFLAERKFNLFFIELQ